MSRTYANGKPGDYAREKLSTLRSRINGEYGALIRPMVPVAFPTGNVEGLLFALVGFTAFSTGWTENTTEAVSTQSFHEVGPFQCPAGLRTGPAPNADPRSPHNAYGRLATSALVRQLNGGQNATMAPDGWKSDHRASCAVGIANLLDDERSLRGALQPGLAGDASGWSYWRVACMFTAFSRGPGQAALVINHFAAELRATPESLRWRRLRELVIRDIREGRSGIGAREGKKGAAYALTRTDQKLESGALLAATVGSPAAGWFTEQYRDNPADGQLEDIITRRAYSTSITSVALDAAAAASSVVELATNGNGPKIVAGIVLVLALFTAAAITMKGT